MTSRMPSHPRLQYCAVRNIIVIESSRPISDCDRAKKTGFAALAEREPFIPRKWPSEFECESDARSRHYSPIMGNSCRRSGKVCTRTSFSQDRSNRP